MLITLGVLSTLFVLVVLAAGCVRMCVTEESAWKDRTARRAARNIDAEWAQMAPHSTDRSTQ